MPKTKGNVVQSIDADELARLPPFAKYMGDDPALANLRGIAIPTSEVERLVYVGERENVWVDDGKDTWRPWLGVEPTYLDDEGNVILPDYEEPDEPVQRDPMDRAQLAAAGFTDASLDEAAQEVLGERWVPDRPGASDARRRMYQRVSAAFVEEPPTKPSRSPK